MSSKLPPLLLAVVLLVSSGCVVSEVPLIAPEAAQPDSSLIGTWLQQDENETRGFIIGRYPYTPDNQLNEEAVPRGIMSIQGASPGNDGELPEPISLLFFPSQIGKDTYLNVFERKAVRFDNKWTIAPNTRFTIVKYRVDKNTLSVWTMEPEKVRAAVANETLRGRNEAKGLIRSVVLDNAMALTGYLGREGSTTLFSDTPGATLVRARLTPEK